MKTCAACERAAKVTAGEITDCLSLACIRELESDLAAPRALLEAVEKWAEGHYKDGRCNLCGAPRESHEEMSPGCRVRRLDAILEGGER